MAFSNQLISALVSDGFNVLKAPDNALCVEIDTQVVHFSANRSQRRYVGVPTVLATGVLALRNAGPSAVAGAAFAGIVAADVHSWFQSEFASGRTPQTEIIVTTSVTNDRQYLVRSTNIYYVADADSGMYVPPPPPKEIATKNIEVTEP